MLTKLVFLIVGYFLGVITCNWLFRESFKRYTEEVHKNYVDTLNKVKRGSFDGP